MTTSKNFILQLEWESVYISNRSGYAELWFYQINTASNQQITQLEASYIERPAISTAGKLNA